MERIYFSVKIKKLVRERAQHTCEYCRCLAAFSPDPFVIEHSFSLPLAARAQRYEQRQQSRLRLFWLQ
jgi:hypothetical protein